MDFDWDKNMNGSGSMSKTSKFRKTDVYWPLLELKHVGFATTLAAKLVICWLTQLPLLSATTLEFSSTYIQSCSIPAAAILGSEIQGK